MYNLGKDTKTECGGQQVPLRSSALNKRKKTITEALKKANAKDHKLYNGFLKIPSFNVIIQNRRWR